MFSNLKSFPIILQVFDVTEWIRKDVAKRLAGAAKGGKGGKKGGGATAENGGKGGGGGAAENGGMGSAGEPVVFCCGDFNEEGASAVHPLLPPPLTKRTDGLAYTSPF